MRAVCSILLSLLMIPVAADAADFPMPRRPVATYSIVARDSVTGQLGVAVQSHWFSVGALVPWAEAGVGVSRGGAGGTAVFTGDEAEVRPPRAYR